MASNSDLMATLRELLAAEGAVAISTSDGSGGHLVATWNSYVELIDGQRLAFPAGGYNRTENNVRSGSGIQLLIANREVMGKQGRPGTGYRLTGEAEFQTQGPIYDRIKARFPWARAAVVVNVADWEQLL